jgi:hypothetical protein
VKIVAAISRKKMLMNVKNAGLFSALSVSAKVARTNSKTTDQIERLRSERAN